MLEGMIGRVDTTFVVDKLDNLALPMVIWSTLSYWGESWANSS